MNGKRTGENDVKFRILVKDSMQEWRETFDLPATDAHAWAKKTVSSFNSSLRPGELPRELLKVEVIDEENTCHDWIKRTDGMSVSFRGRVVDLMFCKQCGATGKRYGLSSDIKRDSKYRAKKWEHCPGDKIADGTLNQNEPG